MNGVPTETISGEISEVRRDQREFERFVAGRLNDIRGELHKVDLRLEGLVSHVRTVAGSLAAGVVLLELVMKVLFRGGG